MIIAGFIILAIGFAVADSGFDVETEGGSQSFNIEMSGNQLAVYIAETADCIDDAGYSWDGDYSLDDSTRPSNPTPLITFSMAGQTQVVHVSCSIIISASDGYESWENTHDPPLRQVGSMTAPDDPNSEGYPDDCTSRAHCEDPNDEVFCIPQCDKLIGTCAVICTTNCWVFDSYGHAVEAVGGFFAMLGLVLVMAVLLGVGDLLLCIACCVCCQGPDKGAGPPVQGMVVGQPVGSA